MAVTSDGIRVTALVADAYDLSFSRYRQSDRDDLVALTSCVGIVNCICFHLSVLVFGMCDSFGVVRLYICSHVAFVVGRLSASV